MPASDCSLIISLVFLQLLIVGKRSPYFLYWRVGDFLKGGESIATNILADRLALLECAGILSKTAHPDSKAKVLYALTPKGIDLAPVLVEIIAWSEKHYEVHPQAIAFAGQIKKDKAAVLAQIYAQLNRKE
jgi:DNA-binding HxlR family transcriptional regulator